MEIVRLKKRTITKIEEGKEYQLQYSAIKNKNSFGTIQVKESRHAANYARRFYKDDISIFESVFAIALDRSNQIIGWTKISQGGVSMSVIDPKIVAKFAIDMLASGIILVHNHPAGTLNASNADKAITQKLKGGLAMLEVCLLDHIILTKGGHLSFADDSILS